MNNHHNKLIFLIWCIQTVISVYMSDPIHCASGLIEAEKAEVYPEFAESIMKQAENHIKERESKDEGSD